jgi:hypothetical protein
MCWQNVEFVNNKQVLCTNRMYLNIYIYIYIIDHNPFTCWYSIIWTRRSFHLPNSNFLYCVHNSQPPYCTTRLHCESLLRCTCSVDPMHFDVILPPAPYFPQILQQSFSMPGTYRLHFLFFCFLTLIIQNSANCDDPHYVVFPFLIFRLQLIPKKSNFCLLFKSHQTFCKVGTKFQTCFNISIKIIRFHFFLLNMCCIVSNCRR